VRFALIIIVQLSLTSCASYIIPQQTYSGFIGSETSMQTLGAEKIATWKAAAHRKLEGNQKLIILHQGIDQLPNVRQPSLDIDQVEFLKSLRIALEKTERFHDIEIVSIPQWDIKTVEDIRRLGILYNTRYVLLLSGHYDIQSFFSSIGHYVGWIPYINFVVPLYKLEGSVRADFSVLDIRSGAFVFVDTAVIMKKKRGSGLFLIDHYRALSREVHFELSQRVSQSVQEWLRGT
jgi:hypothetical protein